MQFGAGPELAAQCPSAPIPDGWRAWNEEVDGPIPTSLSKRARALIADQSVPLGATESYPLPGVTTLIRIEPHAWGRNAQGDLIAGCFRAGGVYLPDGTADGAGITPPETGINKTVSVLTAVSLTVGTLATLATWNQKS